MPICFLFELLRSPDVEGDEDAGKAETQSPNSDPASSGGDLGSLSGGGGWEDVGAESSWGIDLSFASDKFLRSSFDDMSASLVGDS